MVKLAVVVALTPLAPALGLLGGCVAAPTLAVPAEPEPLVCETTGAADVLDAGQLSIAPTINGATVVWLPAAGGAIRTRRMTRDAQPYGIAVAVWPGDYRSAAVATVDDQVVVGAVDGDVTWMLGAPLGIPPFRELGLLGGVVGESPVVVANGDRVAPTVSYGGLLVNGFDGKWDAHTSQLAVLTGRSREVAATAVAREAVAVWATDDACYVERIFGVASGASISEPIACHAPRIATNGDRNDVGLVFEGPDGVYLVHGQTSALHPAQATRIGAGHSPKIVAVTGRYWISYVDDTGAVVAGVLGSDDVLRTLALEGTPTTHELAVVGGLPRLFTVDGNGLTVSALCAE